MKLNQNSYSILSEKERVVKVWDANEMSDAVNQCNGYLGHPFPKAAVCVSTLSRFYHFPWCIDVIAEKIENRHSLYWLLGTSVRIFVHTMSDGKFRCRQSTGSAAFLKDDKKRVDDSGGDPWEVDPRSTGWLAG